MAAGREGTVVGREGTAAAVPVAASALKNLHVMGSNEWDHSDYRTFILYDINIILIIELRTNNGVAIKLLLVYRKNTKNTKDTIV